MSTSTPDAYEVALQTIAKVENENLTEIAAVVRNLRDTIVSANEALVEKRASIPVVAGTVNAARSDLDNWIAQIQSSSYQIEQIAQVIRQKLDLYNGTVGSDLPYSANPTAYTTPTSPPIKTL